MKALEAIIAYESGNLSVLKSEKWLQYLALTKVHHGNLERVSRIKDLNNTYVLHYVKRTLEALSDYEDDPNFLIVETILKWSEVAKTGMDNVRKQWVSKGYNLNVHNVGSARIFEAAHQQMDEGVRHLMKVLIETHGLIGQHLRGEVAYKSQVALFDLVETGYLEKSQLKQILTILNECILKGVDVALFENLREKVQMEISGIINNDFTDPYNMEERLRALRHTAIENGEDFDKQWALFHKLPGFLSCFEKVFENASIWYVEAALHDFSFEEFYKIFLLVAKEISQSESTVLHISFEHLMYALYYDRDGQKRTNLYKKRLLEHYLKNVELDNAGYLVKYPENNIHVKHVVQSYYGNHNTVFFEFQFSSAASQLLAFCEEAEKADARYEQAIILLYDFFELRKDPYDRFYNEAAYLETMNQSIDYKKVLLEYIVGNHVVDIGPGGGALMDLIEAEHPNKSLKITGVDISHGVIETLNKKRTLEHKSWQVCYGDALNLNQVFEPGSVDTIIFCSILHELYSYIEFEGHKFNRNTLKLALQNAFKTLSVGGRILIRDGIMTESVDEVSDIRFIQFLSDEGLQFLKQYALDFKGRAIEYTLVEHNTVKMSVNDAMEFLYTYTWGNESYVHEVQEQFGYFTPKEYVAFIQETLGERCQVLVEKHYLQQGYILALSSKVKIMDGHHMPTQLPDSTCLIVIEKKDSTDFQK